VTGTPFHDRLRADAAGGSPYLPLTRRGTVRSLLPAEDPAVLRAALGRGNGPESWPRHLLRRGYAAAAGARLAAHRLGPRLVHLDDGDLVELVAAAAGRPLHLSVHFGPPRANRKPVVLGLDDRGRLVVVAKVASDPLTERLVRTEAVALRELAGGDLGPALVVPRVLALDVWRGHTVLVQSSIAATARHRRPPAAARLAAERALGAVVPPAPGGAVAWVAALRDRAGALAEEPARDGLLRVLDAVEDRLDPAVVRAGPSHGDWSPQNVAAAGTRVAAWDWERFARDRPLGYDGAHHA
jgi:hypothetical protein